MKILKDIGGFIMCGHIKVVCSIKPLPLKKLASKYCVEKLL